MRWNHSEPAGPSRFRSITLATKGHSARDERLCDALCRNDEGEIEHRVGCRIGIEAHNQQVNSRQVRRQYARIMAKRGAK